MTIPTRTYTYIANTLAQSNQANVNENSLYAWANGGIDDTNLNHLVGIYASSITGTTAAQCTFGTNPAASAGYKFVAPSSGLVPLTISGVSSQSADIFDVTLTSGGTKAAFIDSAGTLNFGAIGANGSASNAYITGDTAGNIGMIFSIPASSTNGYRWIFGSANWGMRLTTAPNLYVLPGTGQSVSTPSPFNALSGGDAIFQRGASSGQIVCGGATHNGSWDYGLSAATSWTARNEGGYSQVNGSTYNTLSDASQKTNVAPITGALATLAQLKPSSYQWVEDSRPDFGFIAQDVHAVLPQLTRTDSDGLMGLSYTGFIPWSIAAILELESAFKAYVAAHP